MNMEWRPEYEIKVSQHAEPDSKLSVVIQAPAWTWANWGKLHRNAHAYILDHASMHEFFQ